MKGIDLIKYIYDNKLTDADIVIGVEGYICDGIANDKQIQIRKMEDGRVLISDHCGEYEQHFKAKEYYNKIVKEYPDSNQITNVKNALQQLNEAS